MKNLNKQRIINAVCELYGVTEKQLVGKSRCAKIAVPRQIAMYIIREKVRVGEDRKQPTFAKIGEKFGRTHCTAIAAHRNIGNYLQVGCMPESVINIILKRA